MRLGRGLRRGLQLGCDQAGSKLTISLPSTIAGRGCWVDLSANDQLTPEAVLDTLRGGAALPSVRGAAALHVGYPHLLRHLRGEGLARLLAGPHVERRDAAFSSRPTARPPGLGTTTARPPGLLGGRRLRPPSCSRRRRGGGAAEEPRG